jgi:hypothetical protein
MTTGVYVGNTQKELRKLISVGVVVNEENMIDDPEMADALNQIKQEFPGIEFSCEAGTKIRYLGVIPSGRRYAFLDVCYPLFGMFGMYHKVHPEEGKQDAAYNRVIELLSPLKREDPNFYTFRKRFGTGKSMRCPDRVN